MFWHFSYRGKRLLIGRLPVQHGDPASGRRKHHPCFVGRDLQRPPGLPPKRVRQLSHGNRIQAEAVQFCFSPAEDDKRPRYYVHPDQGQKLHSNADGSEGADLDRRCQRLRLVGLPRGS